MNKIKILVLSCLLLFAGACRKYVEIPPEQIRALKYTTDYQALLNYSITIEPGYSYPVFMADDYGVEDDTWYPRLTPASAANAYTWSDQIYTAAEEDNDWSTLYRSINVFNTVATNVMVSEGGTETEKKAIQASAMVHRAYAYFTLVNMYGKQFDAATAATDPGVPLLLTPSLYADLTRASVQKVYDQVKADLDAALPYLPEVAPLNVSPSKLAIYALMARVSLNTRDFAEAKRYAELALSLRNGLLDLNNYLGTNPVMPQKLANPEEMFFKRTGQFFSNIPLNPTAVSLYDTRDLRYVLFTRDASAITGSNFTVGKGSFRPRLFFDGLYIGPGVPEMLLIKAECEARAGNTANAMDAVNTLRKKRFKPAEYTDLTAANANAALRVVIDERQREFMGRGYRWFDQRRLAKDQGLIGTVTRKFKGTTYTLQPNSNRYVFPIGDKYIQFNPEIIQNPR